MVVAVLLQVMLALLGAPGGLFLVSAFLRAVAAPVLW
jgi:hypothetical protein